MQRIDRYDRETFIAALLKAVPTATREHALKLLRWGATYGRLAEAQCNGGYPADNGEGKTYQCPKCEIGWRVRSALKECPDCRAERIIDETCISMRGDVTPDFQGDPRGHTVRLQIAGAPLDAYERPALAIPTS
jgi:hypothetical protein